MECSGGRFQNLFPIHSLGDFYTHQSLRTITVCYGKADKPLLLEEKTQENPSREDFVFIAAFGR